MIKAQLNEGIIMKRLLIILSVSSLAFGSFLVNAETSPKTQSNGKAIEYAGAKGRPAAPKPSKASPVKAIKNKVGQGAKKVAKGTKKVVNAAKKAGHKVKATVSKGTKARKGGKQTKSAGGKKAKQASQKSNNNQSHNYQQPQSTPKHQQATWKEKGYLDNAFKVAKSRTQEDLDRAAKKTTTTTTDKVEKNHDLNKPPIDFNF